MAEPQLSPQLQQQVAQLQQLNQQLAQTAQQRAQFEVMKSESEQALEALGGLDAKANVYRSVGALLVQDSKDAAEHRLKEDVETLGLRVTRFGKQEEQLKQQLTALQQKIQAALKATGQA
jgi:prefoldin beta subunit